MAQQTLNRTIQQLKLKSGLRANLLKTATSNLGVQAEPAYTTDTKQLFIHDGTSFVPVQTLDMALCVRESGITLRVRDSGKILLRF